MIHEARLGTECGSHGLGYLGRVALSSQERELEKRGASFSLPKQMIYHLDHTEYGLHEQDVGTLVKTTISKEKPRFPALIWHLA